MAKKILIIDDEVDVLKVLKFRLEKSGYEVITALDGIKGLELAVHEHPDLVILDIMMPGGDGYSVCEKLKRLSATATLPVVFLSAKTEDKDVSRGYQSGALFYIKKPYDPEFLLDIVKKALEFPQELEEKRGVKKMLLLTRDSLLKKTIQENFSDLFESVFINSAEELKFLPSPDSVDVIILDLAMKEIDFKNLILAYRSRFKKEALFILIIEPYLSGVEDIASAVQYRYEYLRRPFEIDSLRLLLRDSLKR